MIIFYNLAFILNINSLNLNNMGILIGIFCFFGLIYIICQIGEYISSKNRQNKERKKLYEVFGEYSSEFKYFSTSYDGGLVLLNDKNNKILIGGKTLKLSDIKSVELRIRNSSSSYINEQKHVLKTNNKSVIGRSIVGGALGGGVGAIIGGVTAQKEIKTINRFKKVKDPPLYGLNVTFANGHVIYLYAHSERDITNLRDFLVPIIEKIKNNKQEAFGEKLKEFNLDPLFIDVAEFVVQKDDASSTLISKQFNIDEERSWEILKQLDRAGIISLLDPETADVLLIKDELENHLMDYFKKLTEQNRRPKVIINSNYFDFLKELHYYDPLLNDAAVFVIETQSANFRDLQRKLGIEYNRCERIFNQLERVGIVSKMKGSLNREVLIKNEDSLVELKEKLIVLKKNNKL